MTWRDDIRLLREFLDDPSPLMRYSAQARLERIEDFLENLEEQERRDQEELDRFCDEAEAMLTETLHGPDIFPAGM